MAIPVILLGMGYPRKQGKFEHEPITPDSSGMHGKNSLKRIFVSSSAWPAAIFDMERSRTEDCLFK